MEYTGKGRKILKVSALMVMLPASACVTPGGTSRLIPSEGLGEVRAR